MLCLRVSLCACWQARRRCGQACCRRRSCKVMSTGTVTTEEGRLRNDLAQCCRSFRRLLCYCQEARAVLRFGWRARGCRFQVEAGCCKNRATTESPPEAWLRCTREPYAMAATWSLGAKFRDPNPYLPSSAPDVETAKFSVGRVSWMLAESAEDPIRGARYKSLDCEDFDLCGLCHEEWTFGGLQLAQARFSSFSISQFCQVPNHASSVLPRPHTSNPNIQAHRFEEMSVTKSEEEQAKMRGWHDHFPASTVVGTPLWQPLVGILM